MNASKLAVAALIFLGVALVAVVIRLNMAAPRSGVSFAPLPENQENVSTTTSTSSMNDPATADIKVTDEKVGTGAEAVAGKQVTVHYVGTLDDGTKFDSSRDRGTPFTFALGVGQVIKGWDVGVAGMKVGGIRNLVIPPSLGYGGQAVGSIPPNSTLHFQVELLGVK